MPTISSEELGRRRFQVLRDKAAEDALEKIRKSLAAQDEKLTPDENVKVRDALREVWSGIDPVTWQSFSFARLSKDDIRNTLSVGKPGTDPREAVPAMAVVLKRILQEKQ